MTEEASKPHFTIIRLGLVPLSRPRWVIRVYTSSVWLLYRVYLAVVELEASVVVELDELQGGQC